MKKLVLISSLFFVWNHLSFGAEISLVEGLYRSSEVDGGLSQSEIVLGTRYSEQFDAHMYWFGQASLSMKSYSTPNGASPSDSNDINLAGGARYYLERFSNRISPYAEGMIELANRSNADGGGTAKTSGLFYSGHLGLRFSLSDEYFADLSWQTFESALSGSVEYTPNGGGASTKTSRTDLYFASSAGFTNSRLSIGMRF